MTGTVTGTVNLAYDYPILGAFWTVLLVFTAALWLVLLFKIIADIFRDDTSGWVKTGWLVFVILLPFLGVFAYVVVRGKGMRDRELAHAKAQQKQFDRHIRSAVGPTITPAEQLAQLTDMHDRGAISDQEFQEAKTKVLR